MIAHEKALSPRVPRDALAGEPSFLRFLVLLFLFACFLFFFVFLFFVLHRGTGGDAREHLKGS